MAGITLAQAEAQLALWLSASEKVATGQEYQIGDRRLKRADAVEIRQQIDYWQGWVKSLSNSGTGGITVRGITPA